MEFSSVEKEIIESYTRYNYTLYNQWLSAFSRVGNVAQRLRIYHIFSTKLSNRENAEYAIPFVARYLDAFLYSIFPPRNVSLFELNATFSFFLSLFLFFISHRDASDWRNSFFRAADRNTKCREHEVGEEIKREGVGLFSSLVYYIVRRFLQKFSIQFYFFIVWKREMSQLLYFRKFYNHG